MMRERFSGYVMFLFLFFAAVSAALGIWQTRGAAAVSEPEKIISGQWASAYEQEFNKAVSIHEPSIGIWDTLNYTLYRDGREGVLIGDNDWLFTKEEFDYHPDAEKEFRRKVEYIASVKEKLAQRDIELVVALLPAKARVYRDHLGDYRYPTYKQDDYSLFSTLLKANGIVVADILSPMDRRKDDVPVFLRTDTHWTPEGAELAARKIASVIEREFGDLDLGGQKFRTVSKEMVEHEGDLLRFVSLGPLAEEIGPKPDKLRVTETEKVAGDGELSGGPDGGLESALFGDEQIPVALVGTSYSANPLWNFGGFLKEELQADVLNAAEEGQGPFTTMEDYINDGSFEANPPKIVVWEIPERYIPVAYDLGI